MKKYVLAAIFAALLPMGVLAEVTPEVSLNMGLRVAALRYAEVGVPLWTKDEAGCLPVFAGGKLGFTDLQGAEMMAPTYEKDRDALDYYFQEGRMRVKKNGKYGFLDKKLNEVVPCQYEEVADFEKGYAKVKTGGRWGFVKHDGTPVCPAIYKRVVDFSDGLAAVVGENDSLGFINREGELVIPCKFDNKENPKFHGTPSACNVSWGGKLIQINSQGEDITGTDILMTENYTASHEWKEELKRLTKRSQYELAATPYDEINYLSGKYLMVMKKKEGKRYGVLRFDGKNSKEVIPCGFDNVFGPYIGGPIDYFVVENSGKFGAYTTDGKELLPCEYQMVGKGGAQLILVEKNDLFGFVDGTGKEVVPCRFSDARPFNAAITAVEVTKKDKMVWNFIDRTGKQVFVTEYDDAMTFENGICPVKRKGKWGFINEQGKEVIPFKYDYSFSDDNERWSYSKSAKGDLIPVSKEGKFGYVDLTGKTIIKFIYEDASAFNKVTRQARVQSQGKTFYIDTKGNRVEPITEEEMTSQAVYRAIKVEKVDGKMCVTRDGKPYATYLDDVKPFAQKSDLYTPVKIATKWGLMNGKGEVVVPCIYEAIDVKGDMIIVRVLNKKGFIDAKGNSLLPAEGKAEKVEWIPLPVNEYEKMDLRLCK